MPRTLELGILDIEPPSHAIEIAPIADRLGYSRYWLGEHHEGNSSPSPDILTALVAGLTKRMRVGPGGVILNFRSPLKVAEDFRLLSQLFPGRIDLGLARGVAEPATLAALLDGRPGLPTSEEHARRVADVCGLVHGNLPSAHPLQDKLVLPLGLIEPPQIWVLGSSRENAETAARLGAAFCVAEHFVKGPSFQGPDAVRHYRDRFVSGRGLAAPLWSVCVGGSCAETESAAARALHDLQTFFHKTWVGTPAQCREQILETADRYDTREVIVCDLGRTSLAAKRRSYSLLADVLLPRNPTAFGRSSATPA
jgi:luciferase family oxidoreductase group 1